MNGAADAPPESSLPGVKEVHISGALPLGLDALQWEGRALAILNIREGPITDWNNNGGDPKIEAGDLIVRVNGSPLGDPQAMGDELRRQGGWRILLEKSQQLQVGAHVQVKPSQRIVYKDQKDIGPCREGHVVRLDAAGDADVEFDGDTGARFILRRDFRKLAVIEHRKSCTPPSRDQQLSLLERQYDDLERRVEVLRLTERIYYLKLAAPLASMVLCAVVSEILLGVATRNYASEMLSLEGALGERNASLVIGPVHDWLLHSQSLAGAEARSSELKRWDPVLRLAASLLAALFIVSTMRCRELLVWNKAFFSQSLLLLSQGVLAAVTTAPSPAGWPACRDHLGADFLRRLNYSTEAAIPWPGAPLPVCAGVAPWSGRAAMTAIYALGLYELLERRTSAWGGAAAGTGPFSESRRTLLTALAVVAIVQQLCEANAVVSCRLASSSAALASVAVPLLLYTNGAVAIAAKRWLRYATPELPELPLNDQVTVVGGDATWVPVRVGELVRAGTVATPPCCAPFCCLRGYQHLISEGELERMLQSHINDPEDGRHARALEQLRMRPAEDLLSKWLDAPRLGISELGASGACGKEPLAF